MTSQIIKVDPFDLVVFGGTGDLAYRKLFPALFHRDKDNQFNEPTRIIGVSRRPMERDAFRAAVKDALLKFGGVDRGLAVPLVARFLDRIDYAPVDVTGEDGWDGLKALLGADERVRAYYMATSPDLFGPIAKQLGAKGLVTSRSRIIVEKPIGKDGASAAAINDEIGSVFPENRIFRIDHYLGKETVQNLMALRFANALFEPLWNNAHIDHVQITVAETLGVEGRGAYYDTSGAIRDMVQNHMLQLLCLVAMEPPASLEADALRDEKLKVLKSLARIDASNASHLDGARPISRRLRRRRGGLLLSSGYRQGGQRHGNFRRPEDRRLQLALGGRAVLSAHRQEIAAALFGNRDRFSPRAARYFRFGRRFHSGQPPGHPRAAR